MFTVLLLSACRSTDPEPDDSYWRPEFTASAACELEDCIADRAAAAWYGAVRAGRLGAAVSTGELSAGELTIVASGPGGEDPWAWEYGTAPGSIQLLSAAERGAQTVQDGALFEESMGYGEPYYEGIGLALSPLRDVDGDGAGELAVTSVPWSYRVVAVLDGPFTLPMDAVLDADASPAIRLDEPYQDMLGAYLDWADLDGDGRDELVMSAGRHPSGGVVYGFAPTFDGTQLGVEATPAWSQITVFGPEDRRFGEVMALTDLNGDGAVDLAAGDADGLWLVPGPLTGPVQVESAPLTTRELHTVRAVGDLDGDGLGDLALLSGWEPGALQLLFGRSDLDTAALGELPTAPGTDDARWYDVIGGDFDGDGHGDLAAVRSDADYRYSLAIWYGPLTDAPRADQPDVTLTAEAADDHLGAALATLDADGDGRTDLVIGAPDSSVRYAGGGAVYLVLGRDL